MPRSIHRERHKECVETVSHALRAIKCVLRGLRSHSTSNSQLFAALANIRREHHDRFAIPSDIYEAVAIQWAIHHFNYRAGRDCRGTILPILLNDCQRRNVQPVTLTAYWHLAPFDSLRSESSTE